MGWIIFGVIALCITLFLLKNSYWDYDWTERDEEYTLYGHTYTKKVRDKKEYKDKFKMPLWYLLLLIVAFTTPIINVIIFSFIMIMLIIGYYAGDLHLHFQENSLMSKICSFFNRNVF